MPPVLLILLAAAQLHTLQEPRTYDAVRSASPIIVDGDLDDGAWAAAPWTEEFVDILGPPGPEPELRTRAKVLWDADYLYVGAEMEEPHLWATLRQRDAIVYRDDDFEVFLDPDGDGADYFEVEINALGTVLDLFLDRPYREGGRADTRWDLPGLKTAVSLAGTLNDPSDTDQGWSVELAIPWAELVPPSNPGAGVSAETPTGQLRGGGPPLGAGLPPRPGDRWRINLSRVDWPLEIAGGEYRKASEPSRENRHPESNWVWSPQGTVDMHIPSRWGVVRFVEERP